MTDRPDIVVPRLEALGLSTARPLVLVDVDEVLGLFMQAFGDFLADQGLEMRIDRFALFQNIYRPGAAEHLEIEEGRKLFGAFFGGHCHEIEPGVPTPTRWTAPTSPSTAATSCATVASAAS